MGRIISAAQADSGLSRIRPSDNIKVASQSELQGNTSQCISLKGMAGTTGLEPATSDVTGRRSNQLNYVPANRKDFSTILARETGAHNAARARETVFRSPTCR